MQACKLLKKAESKIHISEPADVPELFYGTRFHFLIPVFHDSHFQNPLKRACYIKFVYRFYK